MEKRIQAGVLNLSLTHGAERLDELMGFASRENHKRGFLFVSKVLGKHVPLKPSSMRSIYDELAVQCSLVGSTYVMGLAETAVGLGAGFADSLANMNASDEVYYQHTTRHTLDHPLWFTIDETHSHAIGHLIYHPSKSIAVSIKQCKTLVLIDDEITTGNTLRQLAFELIERIPSLEKLIIVSLVSWLNHEATTVFDNLPLTVEFVELVKGSFSFETDPQFSSELPKNTDSGLCEVDSRDDIGRVGMLMPYRDFEPLAISSEPIVVVGTGEHVYLPFLQAEQLEQKGVDVLFQSTSRSPILMGDLIARKMTFRVVKQKINYLYNLPFDRKPVVVCETPELARSNGFYNGSYEDVSI